MTREKAQRPPGSGLAAHLAQIFPGLSGLRRRRPPTACRLDRPGARQVFADLEQMGGPDQFGLGGQRSFRQIIAGQQQRTTTVSRRDGRAQGSMHRPQPAVQGELADGLEPAHGPGRELAGRRQDAQSDRQIEATARLGQIGGRQGGDRRATDFVRFGGIQHNPQQRRGRLFCLGPDRAENLCGQRSRLGVGLLVGQQADQSWRRQHQRDCVGKAR